MPVLPPPPPPPPILAGPVSAVSVAGPGGAHTSTTQGGLTTSFQTGGAQPSASGTVSCAGSRMRSGDALAGFTARAGASYSVGAIVRTTHARFGYRLAEQPPSA